MRKLLFPVAVVVLLGIAAAFVLLKHRTVRQVRTADLLPPETVLLAELPNLSRTAERWGQTALQQLWQEPELQAFLEQPRAKLPALKGSDAWPEIVAQVRPQQAFFAITNIDGDVPRMIAGFSYLGSRAAVEQALENPRANFKAAYPAGKAELLTHGGAEIQTYTDAGHVLAEAFRENWYFACNNLELLQATLDRFDAKPGHAERTLAGQESFQKGFAPLPRDPELALFIQPQTAVQHLQTLVKASGQLDSLAASLEELAQVRAFTATSKIEGADFHDSWFVLTPAAAASTPLARHALALTTPETTLFYAARAPELGDLGTEVQKQPLLTGLLGLSSLADRRIKLPQLSKALGPELAVLLDWPKSDLPTPGIAIDVRDPKPLRDALDELTKPDAAGVKWERNEADGATLYHAPTAGMLLPQIVPSIGVSDRFLTLTFGNPALASRAQKGAASNATVAQAPAFRSATESVGEATDSFGYLHTAALIERAYTALRPVLAMSVAFNPDLSPYIDAGKLPSAEVLAKHLGSTAYVKRTTPEGILSESKGPITYDQTMVSMLAIYGVTAFPMAKQMIQSGSLTSGLVPSVPSLPPPGAATPPPPAAAPSPAQDAATPASGAPPK
jgi:hypothetical protein